MIVKKVPNPEKSSSKGTRIRRLVEYVRSPENTRAEEKCTYSGSRGFVWEDPDTQTLEMLALANEAVRSKDTINHYVLSWREGEVPSPEQIEESVDIFVNELGMQGHQLVYGLHEDTDNIHLHLVLNRVHPDSGKVIKPNKGFDIEAGHRAIARIEHAQGWKPAPDTRYLVLEDGALARRVRVPKGYSPSDPSGHVQSPHGWFEMVGNGTLIFVEAVDDAPFLLGNFQPLRPSAQKADMEIRTGQKSAERIAQENVPGLITKVKSWEDLHAQLAIQGMRYERAKSGAVIFVGGIAIKASRACRGASFRKLEKKLGPFVGSSKEISVAPKGSEPMPSVDQISLWKIYIAGRKQHNSDRAVARDSLRMSHNNQTSQLSEAQKRVREEALSGKKWNGRGIQRNALQRAIAEQQRLERLQLLEQQRVECEVLRMQYPPWPDLDKWFDLVEQNEARDQSDAPGIISICRQLLPSLTEIGTLPTEKKAELREQARDGLLRWSEARAKRKNEKEEEERHGGNSTGGSEEGLRKSNLSFTGRGEPPPRARNRMCELSELNLVHLPGGNKMLLPCNVFGDVEQQNASSRQDHVLRRGGLDVNPDPKP